MSKHTPGPWTASGMYFIYAGKGINKCSFAQVFSGDECFADARLISAAPDLLAALEGVLLVADRQTTEFNAARAAIAKATGVTQ